MKEIFCINFKKFPFYIYIFHIFRLRFFKMYTLSWKRIWKRIPLSIHEMILSLLTPKDVLNMRVSKHIDECICVYVLLFAHKHIKINMYPLLTQYHMQQYNNSNDKDNISIGINHIILYNKMKILMRGNDYYGQLGNKKRNLSYNNRGVNQIYHDKVIRQVEAGNYFVIFGYKLF